jgi:hypothetical protein
MTRRTIGPICRRIDRPGSPDRFRACRPSRHRPIDSGQGPPGAVRRAPGRKAIGGPVSGTEGMRKQQELIEKHFKDVGAQDVQ